MPDKAFHSILFPVDFSISSEATAPHVHYMAEQTGAIVILLHVIPWLSAWYGAAEVKPVSLGDADLRRLEDKAEVTLQIFQGKYFAGMTSHCEVQSGPVAETISDRAMDWGADLIMMPTRGLGRTRPFLIGSTTAKVLHDASRPVWTSPHLGDAAPRPYRNLLCTLSCEDISRNYIQEAARLAACFQSKLTFITAVPTSVLDTTEQHSLPHLTAEFLQAKVHECGAPADCSLITDTGTVSEVVKRAAETHNSDLVITNRGHLQQAGGRFVSHVYEIVLESPCPVLSLCIHTAHKSNNVVQ